MSDVRTTVLLVDDNPVGARLIQEALAGSGSSPFRVEWVRRLADALERLGRGGVEVVLLAPILPDGGGVKPSGKCCRLFLMP